MTRNVDRSMTLIAPYLDKKVQATLDGSLFDHVPATFSFRFCNPSELQEELDDGYEDYLLDWDRQGLVPVAAVASAEAPGYEFAWVFLDWREEGDQPAVIVTTTDRWDDSTGVENLSALHLELI